CTKEPARATVSYRVHCSMYGHLGSPQSRRAARDPGAGGPRVLRADLDRGDADRARGRCGGRSAGLGDTEPPSASTMSPTRDAARLADPRLRAHRHRLRSLLERARTAVDLGDAVALGDRVFRRVSRRAAAAARSAAQPGALRLLGSDAFGGGRAAAISNRDRSCILTTLEIAA